VAWPRLQLIDCTNVAQLSWRRPTTGHWAVSGHYTAQQPSTNHDINYSLHDMTTAHSVRTSRRRISIHSPAPFPFRQLQALPFGSFPAERRNIGISDATGSGLYDYNITVLSSAFASSWFIRSYARTQYRTALSNTKTRDKYFLRRHSSVTFRFFHRSGPCS